MDGIDIDATIVKEDVLPCRIEKRAERHVLVPRSPQEWLATLARIGEGVEVLVRIERPKKHSNAQRAYYRGVVLVDVLAGLRAQAKSVGEACPIRDADHLHEFFKALALPSIVGPVVIRLPGTDVSVEMPETTTMLTSKQYGAYIDYIIRFAGERAIPVRAPGEEIYA